jgi:hypothetical protein
MRTVFEGVILSNIDQAQHHARKVRSACSRTVAGRFHVGDIPQNDRLSISRISQGPIELISN